MKLTGSIRMGNDNYHELVTFNRRTADFFVLQAIETFARAVPNEDMFDGYDAEFHLWLWGECKKGGVDDEEVNERINALYVREVLFDYFDYQHWEGEKEFVSRMVRNILPFATPQLAEQYQAFKLSITRYVDILSDYDLLYD